MKHSIRYDLKDKSSDSKDERSLIRVRVSWAGQRVEMLTGLQVKPSYWDAKEQHVLSAYRHDGETGATINAKLSKLSAFISKEFDKHELDGIVPSASDVRHAIRVNLGKEISTSGMSFYECYDAFMSAMGIQNQWSDTTRRRVNNLKNHLYDFAPRLEFADLNDDGLQKFLKFLLDKGLKNTTVEKDISILRWFMRWAVKYGHTKNNTAVDFRPKLKGVDGNAKEIVYLEWDELMRLYEYDFSANACHDAVRDVFCFCCFTGLRYSDVAKLERSDVHDGYISVVTQKTTDGLRIELNDYSRAIISKYINDSDRKRLLPVISNQRMNDYIKDVGKIVGFDTAQRVVYYQGNTRHEDVYQKWELLTTHCARRTFVVNALWLGIPAEVVMKWTGHSDYQSMKPYVAIVDKLKAQEMSKFNSPKIPRK